MHAGKLKKGFAAWLCVVRKPYYQAWAADPPERSDLVNEIRWVGNHQLGSNESWKLLFQLEPSMGRLVSCWTAPPLECFSQQGV